MDQGKASSVAPSPASVQVVADQTPLAPGQLALHEANQCVDQRSDQTREYLKFGVPFVVSIENARLYPRRLKHLVTALVAVCGLATPLGSNIFLRKVSSTPSASDS